MNNDTALVLLLADRQREIEALRARVAEQEDLLHRAVSRETVAAELDAEADELAKLAGADDGQSAVGVMREAARLVRNGPEQV